MPRALNGGVDLVRKRAISARDRAESNTLHCGHVVRRSGRVVDTEFLKRRPHFRFSVWIECDDDWSLVYVTPHGDRSVVSRSQREKVTENHEKWNDSPCPLGTDRL